MIRRNGATYGKLYNWYAVMGITTEEGRYAHRGANRAENNVAGTF
jgi:hypothetical protein